MKRLATILLSLICSTGVLAQTKTISTDLIRQYSGTFTIDDNQIQGSGKDILKTMIKNSQFVTLGELHGSNQISLLTKAMIPLLSEEGFKHFAIEVGPHSAQKLTELSNPTDHTVSNLKAFNAAYSVSQDEQTAIPIPFFDGVSDAEFLQIAREMGMDLWGLDQEFFFSAMFLTDELANTAKGTDNYNTILQLKEAAQQEMTNYFTAYFKKEIEGVFEYLQKDPAVIAYLNAFDINNEKAQQLIKDMKISWDIYINWRKGSHDDRVSYICNNFYQKYKEALKTEAIPKVFTKIGRLHAREIISNGAYDIGFFTQQLADKNGTNSTSIGCWKPYKLGENGDIINNLERSSSYKRHKAFLPLARQNVFTIIDLTSIKKDFNEGKLTIPLDGDYHEIRRTLESFDYLIMLPVDTAQVPNR